MTIKIHLHPTPRLVDLLSQTTLGRYKDHKFSLCPAQAAQWPVFHTDKGFPNLRAQSKSSYG